MERIAALLLFVGWILITVGAGLAFGLPAALITAGFGLSAIGVWALRSDFGPS